MDLFWFVYNYNDQEMGALEATHKTNPRVWLTEAPLEWIQTIV